MTTLTLKETVTPPIEVNQHDVWYRWSARGLEISFGLAFPDVCPSSLASLSAGVVRDGVFVPSGSVARHYAERQRSARKERQRSARKAELLA